MCDTCVGDASRSFCVRNFGRCCILPPSSLLRTHHPICKVRKSICPCRCCPSCSSKPYKCRGPNCCPMPHCYPRCCCCMTTCCDICSEACCDPCGSECCTDNCGSCCCSGFGCC